MDVVEETAAAGFSFGRGPSAAKEAALLGALGEARVGGDGGGDVGGDDVVDLATEAAPPTRTHALPSPPEVSGGRGAPSSAGGSSVSSIATDRQDRWHDDVRGEARVSPALVRGHLILPSMHAYLLLLCVFVLVVGLLSALFFSLNWLVAIEDRLLDAALGGLPGDRLGRALDANERVELARLLWSLLLR